MLRFDKATYLSLLFKFDLSVRLSIRLRRSDVLLLFEFVNRVSVSIISNSLYCYILFLVTFLRHTKNILFEGFH